MDSRFQKLNLIWKRLEGLISEIYKQAICVFDKNRTRHFPWKLEEMPRSFIAERFHKIESYCFSST